METMEMKKKLPVGIESFEKIRTAGFYYVDKTTMIRDLLQKWGEVNIFTRPRRFGKSLNMSMLKAFFEIGTNPDLFNGLAIARETALCSEYMGKFPVVSISLKGVEADTYATARKLAVKVINEEARRLQFLLDSEVLSYEDKELFSQLLKKEMDDETLCFSLRELSELLRKHFGQKVIILIDEYDVPLAKANEKNYYAPMVSLIRNLFEQALKTNENLYFAVLSGCLRVAKESIFTGLNNPKIFSITNVRFDEYFGFTDTEVRDLLNYYHLDNKYETIKDWYDGYRFGNIDVYCPWDVINYCDELLDDPSLEPKDYWSNTSSNDVIRIFIEKVDRGLTKSEIEALIAGETVSKEIHEDLTYNKLYESIDHLWSVLFTTGYLTQRGKIDEKTVQLAIPNMEIRKLFINQIMVMFKEQAGRDGELLNTFCSALAAGQPDEVESCFNQYLENTISIRDTFVRKPLKENFYHGMLLGLLRSQGSWRVKSNAEAGEGYSDISIQTPDRTGIVIELKYADDGNLQKACGEALKQIEEKKYAEGMKRWGTKKILKYGIAFYEKECMVVMS